MQASASKKYSNRPKEGLETQFASSASTTKHNLLKEELKSQWTSFTPTINYCRRLRKGLETQLAFKASTSLVIDSEIFNVTISSIQLSRKDYFLWHEYCCYSGIKDSIPTALNLCKYTWKVVVCMVLTGKGRIGPDIWPETPKQAKSTEEMIRSIWSKEVH